MSKPQLLYVHGGTTFATHDDYISYLKKRTVSLDEYLSWAGDYLNTELSDSFQIIKPRFPNKDNAIYEEWKILFEKYVELLDDNVILIGYSLGGIFLARYLSENIFPKKLLSVYLIAPPFNNDFEDMNLVGGFELQEDISLILKNCAHTTIMGSKTDVQVPIVHFQRYKDTLPDANYVEFEDKNGHFFVDEFPELVDLIKKDLQRLSTH